MMAAKAFSFEFSGLEEIDRLLKELPGKLGVTVQQRALKKAAKPLLSAAILNAQGIGQQSGNLARSLKIDVKLNKFQMRGKTRDRYRADVYVGSTAPHAHLVEFGTQERYRKVGGGVEEYSVNRRGKIVTRSRRVGYGRAYTGTMPANPFLTRAWDSQKQVVWQTFKKEIGNELIKAVRSLAKRAQKGTLSKRLARELAA